ncbi:radial spoke head 10 homolog B isoform X2 [Stegostoma tigrinum]|uniref:radial spoke head 10 homolog B isoform X2 n=2 Tax=Stegostoma tigrinum TaxID=3053191 RepID=UPI00202B06B2|nr:radial spoke head 10 homolog B isoform X2 [Stegostoma tigrinum]
MVKGADRKKKKGKEEREKEKDKEKLTKGKSSELAEEALSEAEPVHSEGNLTCRMVSEHQDETTPDMSEGSERHGQTQDISAVFYEEPILTKLIIESYEGETIRGLYEGVGTAHFQGGHVYQGMFSEGLMHGRGTYTWKNGIKYEGDFSMNTLTGHGTYTWPDGSAYVGEVVNGIRHGKGTFTSTDQLISYTGDWHQAKRHGKGTVYFNQEGSSWYQGDWVNNVREGWGTRRYKSGNVYEGEWKGFQRHGEGTMSWISTNEEYTGQWQNGLQHGFGTHTWFLKRVQGSQYPQRNQYVGEFVMGARQGQGKFYYANGAVYSGEWVANRKHGLGTFTLKNGRTFEGKFIEDRMVEFPELSITGMKIPDLGTMQIQLPLDTDNIKTGGSKGNIKSVLEHNVELDIASLLEVIPKEDIQNELMQLEYATLRYLSELRKIYSFYSSLGHQQTLDNTFLMSKLQFWRFLKDCKLHHYALSLADMDRILNGKFTTLEETHSPFDTLLLGKFLSYIIILAYHIYHKKHEGLGSLLAACFSKIMTNNLIPYACNVNGNLFRENQCVVIALGYINKCWEVYRVYCEQTRRPPNTNIMTMRHFIWMLKDLNLFSKDLTATQVVQILSDDNPAVSDGTYNNMNIEMVFLEFLEALLMCAAVYVTKRLLENSDASSKTSLEVNVIHIASDISLQVTQAPSEQIIAQESTIAEPSEQSTKPTTKKRGESTRKKSKAPASSAEKPSKSSAHHANHGKAGTTSAKNAAKDEEQSQKVAQSAPSTDTNKKQSAVALSEIDKASEKGPEDKAPSEKAPPEKIPEENVPSEKAPSEKVAEEKAPSEKIPAKKAPIKSGAELEFWLSQIYFFFMKRLFPAHDHAEVLKVEAKRDMVRQNELTRQAMIKAATRARLKEEAMKHEQEDTDLLLVVRSPGEQSEDDDKRTYPTQKVNTEGAHLVPYRKGSGIRKKKKSV